MGKKNNTNAVSAPPVEQYRKQIGKQEHKRGKKDMKDVKRRAEAKKSSMGIQDVLLMLGAFLALLASVYFFLYVYLEKNSDSSRTIPEKEHA